MTRLTCAAHFEERGDAWVTPREQEDLQATLKPREAVCAYSYANGRFESVRTATPKPPLFQPPRRRREDTPEEQQAERVRDNMLAIRQLAGLKPRVLAPTGGGAAKLGRIYHPSKEEMVGDPATIAAAAAKQADDWARRMERERAEVEARRKARQ